MLRNNIVNGLNAKGFFLAGALAAWSLAPGAVTSRAQTDGDWKTHAIAPVANPLFFEDPRIQSEARPIFMVHDFPQTFQFQGGSAPLGGAVHVYAAELRYALTDRLGLIATKDGFIEMQPDHTLPHSHGWGDITAGLKYALIDDVAGEFILTPGLTLSVPTGSHSVYQGRGNGEWNVFVSAAKGWKDFHATANVGFRLPNDLDSQTAQAHYSLQLDYYVCQYFIPFVVANGYTVLTEGDNKLLGTVPLNTEMYDLINFGSTGAGGTTMVTAGGGFRTRLLKCLDVGFAYEVGVTNPKGIFEDRFTTDLSWRF